MSSRISSSPYVIGHTHDDQLALRKAFAAIKLESTNLSRNSISVEQNSQPEALDNPSTRKRHSEMPVSSGTVQGSSERRATLEGLWADSNSTYTMNCLDSQFKQMPELDTGQLTREDYECLLQANFRALNEEIVRENLKFVETIQLHERMQQMRQMHGPQQQPLFDLQYSMHRDGYYSHLPVHYPSLDPYSNGLPHGIHSRHNSQGTNPNGHSSIEAAPLAPYSHARPYYFPLPTPEETPDDRHSSGRSTPWSSPNREHGTETPQTRPRGSSRAEYVVYFHSPDGACYPEVFPTSAETSSSPPSRRIPYGYDYSVQRSSLEESPRNGSPHTEAMR